MKTITLDDEVFAELDKLTSPMFSHNYVIKALLDSRSAEKQPAPNGALVQTPESGSLLAFLQSAEYRMLNSGIRKYLALLSWMYRTHPTEFHKVENYRRGNRIYFARSQRAIEEAGNGAIHAKQIPHSPVWTLATLDNSTKRKILSDLLHLCGCKPGEINQAASTISDSDRNHINKLLREM